MKALEISHVNKTYASGTQALSNVHFSVEAGDFMALLGYNGAGKSTLIGIITNLVTKTSGDVTVFGYNIDSHPIEAKRMVGLVPQEFNCNIFEKVIDIVVWQAGYYGIAKNDALIRAEEVLKNLDLWDKRNATAGQLSGGMKRRLMIARALMHRPELLILDEPTAGVDVELRRGMYDYLRKINEEGTTIILTTHYLEEAEDLCKNLTIIKAGEIVAQGGMKDLLATLDHENYVVECSSHIDATKITNFSTTQVDASTVEVRVPAKTPIAKVIQVIEGLSTSVISIRVKDNRLEELFISILEQNT